MSRDRKRGAAGSISRSVALRECGATFVAMALAACGGVVTGPPTGQRDSGEAHEAGLASGCVINSDCAASLVCAFRRCHVACRTSRDCEASGRCVSAGSFNVCQRAEERLCSRNSECASSQICATDGQCRDQCVTDRDCVAGQLCAAGGCAEPSELDGG